jgi:hypothetical protein
VKHAGPAALDALEPLLAAIRAHESLKEKSRGVFYRGSKATLHFHEDPDGLFADLRRHRTDSDFARFRVSTAAERQAFLKALKGAMA